MSLKLNQIIAGGKIMIAGFFLGVVITVFVAFYIIVYG